jgi:hypothetical protein
MSVVAVIFAGSVAAETRSFASPALHGLRLDWCAHFGNGCGKPAADLFCRESGFAAAARFAMAPNIGARGIRTLVFGDGRTCEGPNCSGFSTITCVRPDAPPSATIRKLPTPPPAVTRVLPSPPQVREAAPGRKVVPTLPTAPPVTAQRKPPPKPAPPGTATALPGGPTLVLPAGALLYRPGGDFKLTTKIDVDPASPSQTYSFAGDVTKVTAAKGFIWQVTTSPFGPFGNGSAVDLKPIGLRASAYVLGHIASFKLDFKKLAAIRGAKPSDFYIRILPLARAAGAVVGQPSNVIRVYYASKAPPQPPITVQNTSPPNLFTIKFVSFTPPQFEDPNKWGCVVITAIPPRQPRS